MHAWFQTHFNWGNTQYIETAVLSGSLSLYDIPTLPHFAYLSHIISYHEYIVILFRSKECEDLFLFKCFLNWTIRCMKGIIVRIKITEITCSYHDNQNSIACTSCSETKLPGWRTPTFHFLGSPRFSYVCYLKAEKKASLKSGISLQQRNVRRDEKKYFRDVINYCLSGLSSPNNLCHWIAFILKLKMAPWKRLTQYGFPIKLFVSPITENDGNPVFWLVTRTGSTGMSSHVPSRDCPLLILHRKVL